VSDTYATDNTILYLQYNTYVTYPLTLRYVTATSVTYISYELRVTYAAKKKNKQTNKQKTKQKQNKTKGGCMEILVK